MRGYLIFHKRLKERRKTNTIKLYSEEQLKALNLEGDVSGDNVSKD